MCRSLAKILFVITAALLLFASGSALSASCNKIGYGWNHSCAITTGGALKCWGDNGSFIGGQLGNGTTTASSTPVDVLTLSSGVQAVSGGRGHSCAILSSGGVKCWGGGFGGQLGDGSATMQTSPANYVTGLSSGVQAIAAGENHTCALTTGGAVKCWGEHGSGQLGNGGAMGTGSNVPVNVVGLSSGVQKIAAGGANSCALTTGGGVKCWGNDYYGQLGAGTSHADSASPVNVVGLSSGVVDISINGFSACAVMSSGSVKCWGENGNKKLGDGTSSTNSSTPVNVIGVSNAVAVTVGGYHVCALLGSGGVSCWGLNMSGELGRGTTTVSENPGAVPGLSGVEMIAAGDGHTCATLGDGTIKCWGKGASGQLGNGAIASSNVPVTVSGIACAPVAVNGACGATAGVCSAGTMSGDNGATACGTTRTWTCNGSGGGSNANCSLANPACGPTVLGKCGTANGAPYSSAPTFGLCRSGAASAISGSGPWTWSCSGSNGGLNASCSTASAGTACKARKVSAQDSNTCAITADGGVKCWGSDYSAIPATVAGLTDVIEIKSSPFANCAFIKDGSIKCWGRAAGFPPTGTPAISMTPQPLSTFVSGLPSNIVDIELGLDSACVLTASGDAKCWGGNFFSQLGDGTQTNRATPVDIQGSSGSVAKIAGNVHPTSASGCVLTKEGSVRCWGMNGDGQVGDGTRTRRDAPVGVTGLASGVKDIVAGFVSNCAVTDSGNVKCWGAPFFDAAVPQWTPVSISGLSNVVKISGGSPNTTYCALTSGGGVKCFGSDFMGALGDGGSSPSDSLLSGVDVTGLTTGVVDVSSARGATSTHSCAVTSAGDVKCWGANSNAQLGTGASSPSNTYAPVAADLCPAVNGVCGSANGVGVTSAPSSNLCSAGTATTISGSGPWSWSCNGSGGGTNASCSAPLKVNGTCGSANGVGTTAAPSSGLCSSGSASSVSGSGPFAWTCNGANGGSNASCSAPLMVNGACGSSHGGSFYSAPSTGLCSSGAASTVSGSGPYSWTCAGSNGGSTANCSATRKVDGVCGTANGVGDVNTPTALCSSGNPSGVSTVGTNWNWSCGGINGGTNMNCAAPRIYHGLCGPANGSNVYAKPSSGLCAVGNATTVVGAGPFDWNCNGINGGNNVACSANLTVNGLCGPANGQYSASAPTSGLCSAGSASAVSGSGPFTWSCNGVNGGTASSCSSQAIVHGACGSSNNTPTASAPSSGLCSKGTASAVTGSGPWTWSCNGSGGGTKSHCTAPTPPPPPSFGGACPGP